MDLFIFELTANYGKLYSIIIMEINSLGLERMNNNDIFNIIYCI